MKIFNKLLSTMIFMMLAQSVYGSSYGTGFLISADGYIVTNVHVIENAKTISIRLKNGVIKEAQLIRADKNNDLAVLKVSGSNFRYLNVASSSSVRRGEKVYAMGFPRVDIQGIEPKLTEGIVSSLSGIRDEPTTFQISNPIQPGNSGGPLFNTDGKVIGVVVSTLNPFIAIKNSGSIPQNVNYAVKSNYLIELLNTISTIKIDTRNNFFAKSNKFTDIVEHVEQAVVLISSDSNNATVSRAPSEAKKNPEEIKIAPSFRFEFSGISFGFVNGDVIVLSVSHNAPTTLQKNDRIKHCFNNAVTAGGTRVASITDLKNCLRNHWTNTIFRTFDDVDRNYFGSKLIDN